MGERRERRELRLWPVQLEHLRLREAERLAVGQPGRSLADAARTNAASHPDATADEKALTRT
jgi:hypothetical protein